MPKPNTTSTVAAVAAAAALSVSVLAFPPAPAIAQEHAASPATSDEAYMAELHRQITALFTLVYEHADFDAVEAHLTSLIDENPEAIGGDTDAFAAHVSAFLHDVAENAADDPGSAADFTATVLLESHRLAEGHQSH